MTARALRVLIVDDSAVARESLGLILIGARMSTATAPDPVVARRRMAAARPDVIVLDLEMPRQNGLSFLRDLMREDPIPVVICSSHSPRGSAVALEALHEGAVEVVEKPLLRLGVSATETAGPLIEAVRTAAGARPQRRWTAGARPTPLPAARHAGLARRRLVAIAASTGGPQALHTVLGALPADAPGIVIVQHMPALFTPALARHLDHVCRMGVREAVNGDVVRDGWALIAPGGRHLLVHAERGGWAVEVRAGPPVTRHRPSADVLFESVARAAGPDAVGIVLTGMGDAGAAGLLAMRAAGARTLAQDEASSVVFGMPHEAIRLGAASEVVPLADVAGRIAGLRSEA